MEAAVRKNRGMFPSFADCEEAVIPLYGSIALVFVCPASKPLTWENLGYGVLQDLGSCRSEEPLREPSKKKRLEAKKVAFSAIRSAREREQRKAAQIAEKGRQYVLNL